MVTKPPRQVPPPTRPDGTAAPRTSAYARFIPREELQDFAAWKPGQFEGVDRRATPRPAAAAAPAPVEAPPPPPPPEPTTDELVHAARQSGYQDGYRDGMAALDAFKHSFAQQMSAQIGALVKSFDEDFRALEGEMAQAMTRCAMELARQVVRSEITQRPEHIAKVAHDAVEALLVSARHVRVRVNPADLPLVLDGAGEELRAREAQVLPDPSLPRGGVKVDSDISSVDATLALRWQQVMAALGQSSLWEDRRGSEGEPLGEQGEAP